jgi:hypothetical protein
MLSWSHNGEPYGYVTNGGRPMTVEMIAKGRFGMLAGKREFDIIKALLDELLRNHRIGKDMTGAYFIPKMVRIGEQKEQARRYGRRGGNPALVGAAQAAVNWDAIQDRWNALAKKCGLPVITKMTDFRREKYSARLRDTPDFWEVVEREVPLLGDLAHEGKWFGFDFLIQSEQNFTKFAEGKYRKAGAGPSRSRARKDLTPKERFENVVATIIEDAMKIPKGADRIAYCDSLDDKYRDEPRYDTFPVWVVARNQLKRKGEL